MLKLLAIDTGTDTLFDPAAVVAVTVNDPVIGPLPSNASLSTANVGL